MKERERERSWHAKWKKRIFWGEFEDGKKGRDNEGQKDEMRDEGDEN